MCWRIMAWQIEFDRAALKELKKLDAPIAKRLLGFLYERVIKLENPRSVGQALKGSRLGEFWKYRVGDYRIIAKIEDEKLLVLVLRVANRREVYKE